MGIMFSPGCANCGCPGGDDTVTTECCPDLELPLTLHATITYVSGICSAYAAPIDVELTWDAVNSWYYGEEPGLDGCVWTVLFRCSDTGSGYKWRATPCLSTAAATPTIPCQDINAGCNAGGQELELDPGDCEGPLDLDFGDFGPGTGTAFPACCGCAGPPFGLPVFNLAVTE